MDVTKHEKIIDILRKQDEETMFKNDETIDNVPNSLWIEIALPQDQSKESNSRNLHSEHKVPTLINTFVGPKAQVSNPKSRTK